MQHASASSALISILALLATPAADASAEETDCPPFRYEYSRVAGHAIVGHNDYGTAANRTVDQCKQLCDQITDCRSFDYIKPGKACFLSKSDQNSAADSFKSDPKNEWDYYERQPKAKKLSVSGFTVIHDKGIAGHNTCAYHNIDVGYCADLCNGQSWCRSFEYSTEKRQCNLSNRAAGEDGVTLASYPTDYYAKPAICDHGQEIADLEAIINLQVQKGEHLRRLISLSLPQFPLLDFCVQAHGTELQIEMHDPDHWAELLIAFADNAQSVLGAIGNLSATVNAFEKYFKKSQIPLWIGFSRFDEFLDIAQAGEDFSSSLQSLTNFTKDLTPQYSELKTNKRASTDPKAVIQILQDTTEMLPRVAKVRKAMICTVKQGLPEFYDATAKIEALAEKIKKEIAEDPYCIADGSKMAERLTKLVDLKLVELDRVYQWHAAGVVRPDPAATDRSFVSRHSWIDERLTPDFKSAILEETNCSAN